MPMASTPFNWRGFWADLLSGAGRGLLELDGSREAEAALTGLDYFTAMQRHRRAGQQAAPNRDNRAEYPPRNSTAPDEGWESDQVESPEQGDGVLDPRLDRYRDPYESGIGASSGGLPPHPRPAPLSADPYDHPGLPIALRLGLRGYVRRR